MAKFYVVWNGRTPGIYNNWNSCKAQVDGFAGARYKSFKTEQEAKQAFNQGGQRSSIKVVSKGSATAAKKGGHAKLSQQMIDEMINEVPLAIFCDGACDPNPGPAGSGIAVYQNGELNSCLYGLFYRNGSNNTAELLALHHSLKMVESYSGDVPALVFSDSSYSINAITQWAAGWQAKGWRRSGNEPVKNLEIIKPLYELYLKVKSKVSIHHVAGHAGIEGNELADRMSVIAISEQEPNLVPYSKPLVIDEILSLKRG